jgi:hypothetical protein
LRAVDASSCWRSLREGTVETCTVTGRIGVGELPAAVGPGHVGRKGLPENGR